MVALKYQRTPDDVKKVQLTFNCVDDFVNCISEFSAWGISSCDALTTNSISLSRSNSVLVPSVVSQTEGCDSPIEFLMSSQTTQDFGSFATPTRNPTVMGTEFKSSLPRPRQISCSSSSNTITTQNGNTRYPIINNWNDIPTNFNINMFNSGLSQQETVLSQESDEQVGVSQSLEFTHDYMTSLQLPTPSKTPTAKPIGLSNDVFCKNIDQMSSSKISKKCKKYENKSYNIEIRDDQSSENILSNLEGYIIKRLKDDEFKKLVCCQRKGTINNNII